MASVVFYFQVHQPFRLRRYSIFDSDSHYFDDKRNAEICRKVAAKCYAPTNAVMLDLIRRHEGRFRISYSLTGAVLRQLQQWAPEVLESFRALARTGAVEFIAETYYHSLAFLYNRNEFIAQTNAHLDLMDDLFGQRPRVFRNTELRTTTTSPGSSRTWASTASSPRGPTTCWATEARRSSTTPPPAAA